MSIVTPLRGIFLKCPNPTKSVNWFQLLPGTSINRTPTCPPRLSKRIIGATTQALVRWSQHALFVLLRNRCGTNDRIKYGSR